MIGRDHLPRFAHPDDRGVIARQPLGIRARRTRQPRDSPPTARPRPALAPHPPQGAGPPCPGTPVAALAGTDGGGIAGRSRSVSMKRASIRSFQRQSHGPASAKPAFFRDRGPSTHRDQLEEIPLRPERAALPAGQIGGEVMCKDPARRERHSPRPWDAGRARNARSSPAAVRASDGRSTEVAGPPRQPPRECRARSPPASAAAVAPAAPMVISAAMRRPLSSSTAIGQHFHRGVVLADLDHPSPRAPAADAPRRPRGQRSDPAAIDQGDRAVPALDTQTMGAGPWRSRPPPRRRR